MNQPQDLTDLITTGEVLAVDPDVSDVRAFAQGIEARLSHLKAHSALAIVAAPRDSLPDLREGPSRPIRLFFSTLDDPVVDQARDYLARLMPPRVQLPQPAVLMQMYRNVELRLDFLQSHESWNAAQVAEFAGSSAKNASATAGRWRSDGLIFAVDHDNDLLYPAFQFDPRTRKPKPAIARLLSIFGAHDASSWEIALWLANPRPALDEPPVRLLDSDPGAVIQAAEATYRPVL